MSDGKRSITLRQSGVTRPVESSELRQLGCLRAYRPRNSLCRPKNRSRSAEAATLSCSRRCIWQEIEIQRKESKALSANSDDLFDVITAFRGIEHHACHILPADWHSGGFSLLRLGAHYVSPGECAVVKSRCPKHSPIEIAFRNLLFHLALIVNVVAEKRAP